MAQSEVQLPTDGGGKMLAMDTWAQGANTVYGQDVVLYGPDGNPIWQRSASAQSLAMQTLGANVALSLSGQGTVGFTVSSLVAADGGLLAFEGTVDGTNWFTIPWTQLPPGAQTSLVNYAGYGVAGASTGFMSGRINASGLSQVRVRVSGAASASYNASVTLVAQAQSGLISFADSIPPGNSEIGGVLLLGSGGSSISSTTSGGSGKQPLDVNLASSGSALVARSTNTFGAAPGTISLPNTINVANTTVTMAVADAGNATIDVSASAYVGSIIFEGSADGGTTWFTVNCVREDGSGSDNTIALSIASTTARAWSTSLPGFTHFRVRASAWTSGTLTAGITPGAILVETAPAVVAAFPLNQSIDGAGSAQPFAFAYANVATTQTGATLISAPASGRAIRVISYAVVVGAAMNVSFIGAGTTLLWSLAANGGVSFAGNLQGPAFQCSTATALTWTTTVAAQATVHLCYVVV
jgi:hypothetical protein